MAEGEGVKTGRERRFAERDLRVIERGTQAVRPPWTHLWSREGCLYGVGAKRLEACGKPEQRP